MLNIHQYRQGRLTPDDYIPRWVRRAVEAVHDPRPNDWPITELAKLEATRLPYTRQLQEAEQVLGVKFDEIPTNLVSLTESLIAAQPEREGEFWSAMWTLRRLAETEQRYHSLLQQAADWLERTQQYADQGWPREWSSAHCDIWAKAGGTPQTASAWARAGWSAEQVLCGHLVRNGRTVPFSSRLRETHPSKATADFDWRDSEQIIEVWPAPSQRERR